MAIVDPLHPLQSSILELLAVSPGVSMTELHMQLQKKYQLKISLQNIYRTVGQMIKEQILFREKGKLSLNMTWVSHIVKFGEEVRKQYLDIAPSTVNLPKIDGERLEFGAESLEALDPIWNHIIVAIFEMYRHDHWYAYNSHPWHLLGTTETEHRLHKALGPAGCILYGNNTFLDTYGAKLNPVNNQVKAIANPPFPKEGYIIGICGDYLIECVFPEVISKHFSFFFQTVRNIKQFDAELFSSIFKMRAHCKLTVRKSKKDAEKLSAKIASYFVASKKK